MAVPVDVSVHFANSSWFTRPGGCGVCVCCPWCGKASLFRDGLVIVAVKLHVCMLHARQMILVAAIVTVQTSPAFLEMKATFDLVMVNSSDRRVAVI